MSPSDALATPCPGRPDDVLRLRPPYPTWGPEMTILTDPLLRAWCALAMLALPTEEDDAERGDVPGWVMITIMSASLVIAILAFARQGLADLVSDAFDSVGGAAGTGG